MSQGKPIFYDEKRRRWFFTRRALEIGGALFTLLLLTFFLSVLRKVTLPSLLLPSTMPMRRPVIERAAKNLPRVQVGSTVWPRSESSAATRSLARGVLCRLGSQFPFQPEKA